MKTKFCDECQYARYAYDQDGFGGDLWCSKKHKPRFYNPKSCSPMEDGWGYKRKCGDFKMSKKVVIVKVAV